MTALFLILAFWFGETKTIVKPEELKRTVEEFVQKRYAGTAQSVVVEFRKLPEAVPVADGSYVLHVAPDGIPQLSGNVSLPVDILVQGKPGKRVIVSLKVRTFAGVFVASKQLMQHARITRDLVEVQTLETTLLPQDIITSFDMLNDKRSSRIISQGSVLRESNVESIPLIHQDETVTLIVRKKGLEVSTRALAKEDGRRGDFILVQKIDAHERFRAKVINTKTVQVDIY